MWCKRRFLLLWVLLACSSTEALSVAPASRLISSIHGEFLSAAEGSKLTESIVAFDAHVQDVHTMSPRLAFIRCQDAALPNAHKKATPDDYIELLLKERDGYLSTADISSVCEAVRAASPSVLRLHVVGFVERLSALSDPPTQFPQLQPVPPPVCVHAISISGYDANGQALFKTSPRPAAQPPQRAARGGTARAPSLAGGTPRRRARGGAPNSDRGAKFAEWLSAVYGAELLTTGEGVLDVAGGAGALAFELAVRRGINTTVVDPRMLRLDASQQRTVRYLQSQPAARVPVAREGAAVDGRNGGEMRKQRAGSDPKAHLPLPLNGWGSHFPAHAESAWVVGERGGHGDVKSRRVIVRHLGELFDDDFVLTRSATWSGCSLVVGMHPDEATEAIVDLALQHGKPFAVVPCCVFWRSNQHRMLRQAGDDAAADGEGSSSTVKSWSQFCDYLQAKAPNIIRRAELPMRGRNVVLFSTAKEARDANGAAV